MTDADRVIRILEGGYKKNVLRNNGELVTVTEIIALLQSRQREIDSLRADLEAETRENLRLAEMVKPMEARVMTLDDMWALKFNETVILEQKISSLLIPAIVRDNIKHDHNLEVLQVVTASTDGTANAVYDYYGKTWRCWTSHPTDEQREATPWQ